MIHSLLRLSTSLVLISLTCGVTCQSCYYPNGDLAKDDQPCSTSGDSVCCPLNWSCLSSNGLCYLDNAKYYERRTCTDQTWHSSACPNFCTQNNTATGNEAILQCSSGQYCCDGDRSFNCCTTAGTVFFALPNGNAFTTIGPRPSSATSSTPPSSSAVSSTVSASSRTPITATLSPVAQPSSSADTSSATSVRSSTSATSIFSSDTTQSPRTSNTPAVVVTVQTVVSSNIQGVQTVYITSTPTSSPDSGSSHLSTILGCAIGIPVGIALIALLSILLFLRRRRRRRNHTQEHVPESKDDALHEDGPSTVIPQPQPNHAATRTSEIYGTPLQSPGAVVGKSELEASPAMSQTSSLPGYSPGKHWSGHAQWGQPEGGYKPYRVIHELPGE